MRNVCLTLAVLFSVCFIAKSEITEDGIYIARDAADMGMKVAFNAMRQKGADYLFWDTSNLPKEPNVPFLDTGAIYSYEVTGNRSDGFKIRSIGKYGIYEVKSFS